MKTCPYCSAAADDSMRFCPNCGAAFQTQNAQQPYNQPYQQPYQNYAQPDMPSKGLKVLSFFFPLAGLILFIVNHKQKPFSAKAYGKMALIGYILSIVFGFIIGGLYSFLFGYALDDFDYSSVYTMVMNLLLFF